MHVRTNLDVVNYLWGSVHTPILRHTREEAIQITDIPIARYLVCHCCYGVLSITSYSVFCAFITGGRCCFIVCGNCETIHRYGPVIYNTVIDWKRYQHCPGFG